MFDHLFINIVGVKGDHLIHISGKFTDIGAALRFIGVNSISGDHLKSNKAIGFLFFSECAVVDFPGVRTGAGDHIFFVVCFIDNIAVSVDLGGLANNLRIVAIGVVIVAMLGGFGGF